MKQGVSVGKAMNDDTSPAAPNDQEQERPVPDAPRAATKINRDVLKG